MPRTNARAKFSPIRPMITYVSSNRTFLIAVLVLLGTLIVDVSLSNVWDLVPDHGWGIDIFILMLIVFGAAQYFIFNYIRIRSKILTKKNKSISSLFILAIIAQSFSTAFFLAIALQILALSQYNTLLLTISSDINFGSAAILLFLLFLLFLTWYKRTKKFVMLLYGVSVLLTGATMLIVAITSTEILSNQPAWRDATAAFPNFLNQNTTIQTIQSILGTYSLVSVLLIWTSTALLISHYSKRIGKLKFWAIMSIPIILAVNQYVVVSPIIANNLSSLAGSSLMYGVLLGTTLPAIASGVLFGLPFWNIAMRLGSNNAGSEHLQLAAWGLIFLLLATSGGVYIAWYPPFGLYSVLLTTFSSYLFLIGIYSSAISISANDTLRRSIRKLAVEDSKLLRDIGQAQMESVLEKKVLSTVRVVSQEILEDKGVALSLNDDDAKQYLHDVLREIVKITEKRGPGREPVDAG